MQQSSPDGLPILHRPLGCGCGHHCPPGHLQRQQPDPVHGNSVGESCIGGHGEFRLRQAGEVLDRTVRHRPEYSQHPAMAIQLWAPPYAWPLCAVHQLQWFADGGRLFRAGKPGNRAHRQWCVLMHGFARCLFFLAPVALLICA